MSKKTGFFDVQVNGYGGADFNRDGLSAEALHLACDRLERDGVDGILATLVTDDPEKIADRIAAMVAFREKDELVQRKIAGFQIEGPFLNETDGYRGAHTLEKIRPADEAGMGRMLDAGAGLVKAVTLAPERDAGLKVTRMLVKQGIVVAAGHCNPSLEELNAALDAGLSMFTHLGNGCPMQMHRHDNIIQRVLSLRGKLWICFIADDHHIPLWALGNYIRAAGMDKTIVVTDGQAASGMGPGHYTLGKWEIHVDQNRKMVGPGGAFLLGSTSSMQECYDNLVGGVGLSARDARRLMVTNPRKALGL
jgi:N-acetylglucosamine-6-phosphate deacetylase